MAVNSTLQAYEDSGRGERMTGKIAKSPQETKRPEDTDVAFIFLSKRKTLEQNAECRKKL